MTKRSQKAFTVTDDHPSNEGDVPRVSGQRESSPRWSATTKAVVAAALFVLIAGVVIRFQVLLAPLVFVFLLSFLLFPVIRTLSRVTRLPWGIATTVVFVLLIVVLVASSTALGIVIFQQLSSLLGVLQTTIVRLPQIITEWVVSLPQSFIVLGFEIPAPQFDQIDVTALVNQVIGIIQPGLAQAGNLLTNVASGTATTLGWGVFVLTVAFFTLVDLGDAPDPRMVLANIETPGYDEDIRRLFNKLAQIWNAFVRGQVLLYFLAAMIYFVALTALGVRFALGLSLIAGLARFIPYVGPFIIWGTVGLVAYFQPGTYFGLDPLWHTLIVIIAVSLVDLFFDNVVSPQLFGSVLGVHPAAVLVAVIMLASTVGFIGLLIAAPTLATVQLFGTYALRKLFDLDPWPKRVEDEEKGLLNMSVGELHEYFRKRLETMQRWWRMRSARLRGQSVEVKSVDVMPVKAQPPAGDDADDAEA